MNKDTLLLIHCSLLHIEVRATLCNKTETVTVFGPFASYWTSPLHSALSCVVLLTIKSAAGSLLELSDLCLDPLVLLDPPWTSLSLLFDPLLSLRLAWSIFSALSILVIAVLLLFWAFPSLDLAFLDSAFFNLLSLLSEDFLCCCGALFGGGDVTGGCGWIVGGLVPVDGEVRLVCNVLLLLTLGSDPSTTSVSWSPSVCSLAKLTKTYKNKLSLVSH